MFSFNFHLHTIFGWGEAALWIINGFTVSGSWPHAREQFILIKCVLHHQSLFQRTSHVALLQLKTLDEIKKRRKITFLAPLLQCSRGLKIETTKMLFPTRVSHVDDEKVILMRTILMWNLEFRNYLWAWMKCRGRRLEPLSMERRETGKMEINDTSEFATQRREL